LQSRGIRVVDADAEDQAGDIDPLTRLAIKHGTDKWGPHFYTPIYHQLFAHLRSSAVHLLEIGVGGYNARTVGGSSLAMWAEYFPDGTIVGIDVVPKTLSIDPRIITLAGSQADPAFLDAVCDGHGPFDIIIDDGSHIPQHVVASFYALFPRLSSGGLYVIEDVQTTFFESYGGSVSGGGGTMELALSLLRCLNHAEIKAADPKSQFPAFADQVRSLRAYHNLIIIEKGDNSEPSNQDYAPTNPHAARAMSAMMRELARSPTPEGFANLLDMYLYARNPDRAAIVLAESLARWPRHAGLLTRAVAVARARGDERATVDSIERLLENEPANAALLEELQIAKQRLRSSS
jgi:hypothetical protein